MGGVIVENRMHDLAGRNRSLNGIEKANELLTRVTLHVAADHGGIKHVQRGEVGPHTVPFVVMRHGPGAPLS